MPGVVNMENGGQNGVHSNHDRDTRPNGVSGGNMDSQQGLEKGKSLEEPAPSNKLTNGAGDGSVQPASSQTQQLQLPQGAPLQRSRMNDLPDEIVHITQGYVPLGNLLTRLAQTTHTNLQETLRKMAEKQVPQSLANGNSAYGNDGGERKEDGDANLKKKGMILQLAQDEHAKWVKALVITDWSRNADAVSKLIDIKAHLDGKRSLYDQAQNQLIDLKRALSLARLPNPDLKTALQILSSGECPWIPELGYIPPPALTAEEQLKWIDELNTLLSLRLNLHDYDNIPYHFRKYSIQSGRVTFTVEGEFEVDLTIADEDFEKQFWFIDFRFAFSPSSGQLSDALKAYLEAQVNEILAKDGLEGCYRYLHEFVLTHKINELKRQATELSRGTWTGTLKVEPLNRALAIQYWATRYGPNGPKSWVMIAVSSAKKANGQLDQRHTSHLMVRWYRDNKDMKDVELPFDVRDLSAERLLKAAIASHVEHILSTIHAKLLPAPRFVKRESAMALQISRSEPIESSLTMQLGCEDNVTLTIEPVTGFAAIKPHTRYVSQSEAKFNSGNRDPAAEGVTYLENIRWAYVVEEFNRRGRSLGWSNAKNPLGTEEIKQIIKTRDPFHPVFFQRQGLDQDWFVMMSLSLSGDEWWLVRVDRDASVRQIKVQIRLPLSRGQPDLDDTFWNHLTLFVTGIVSHATDLKELHKKKIKHVSRETKNYALPQQIKLPALFIRLSDILKLNPGKGTQSRQFEDVATPKSRPWAQDFVEVKFKGVQPRRPETSAKPADDAAGLEAITDGSDLNSVVDAVIKVANKENFKLLRGRIDRDVSFSPKKAEFVFRIRQTMGHSILDSLATHVKSIDRLVGFLEAMERAKGSIKCEKVSLRQVTFTYGDIAMPGASDSGQKPERFRVSLDLAKSDIRMTLQAGNPHLRILDLITTIANNRDGLKTLTIWMPLSLPIMRALDSIESKWQELEAINQGRVEVFVKTVDWVSIRYVLPNASDRPRQLTIDVRLRIRQGAPWWQVDRRVEKGVSYGPEEEFNKLLKGFWEKGGDGWRGLSTGAAARPGPTTMLMLGTLDDAVRAAAIAPPPDTMSTTTGVTTQQSQFSASQSFGTQPTSQSQESNTGGKNAPVILD